MAKMTAEERREMIERTNFFKTLESVFNKINAAHEAANEPLDVYMFAWIPVKYIKTDDEYQRSINRARVAKIKGEYNPYKVDVKRLNYRDGWAHAYDGMHTITSINELGIPNIPAIVTFNKPYEWEAEMFRTQLENSSRPNSVSRYLAGVEAKDPMCLEIKAELNKRGITTLRDRRRDETHNIFAFAKVLSIYNRFGIEGMNITLDIIIESGYAKYKGGFSTWMLEIGRTLCRLEYKYNSSEYITILNEMRRLKDPTSFSGMCDICYPDKKGQHGEGAIVSYVKATLGVIPMSDEHKKQLGLI